MYSLHEFLAHVDDVGVDGARRKRALADPVQLRALPQVERDGDHLCPVGLGQPRNGHRGVQPARIRQNDPLHLASRCSVRIDMHCSA